MQKKISLFHVGTVFSLLFVLALVFPKSTFAATFYVDKDSIGATCKDWNNGHTVNKPLCTFNKAHSLMVPGDTVMFRAGTYPPMNITKSGTPGYLLKFTNYPGETVVVDANSTSDHGIRLSKTFYVEVKGFEVKNAKGSAKGGIFIAGDTIGSEATLSGQNRIINNISHDNTNTISTQVFGIAVQNSSDNLIQGNTVYNNKNSGINIFGSPGVVVTGNQIIGNTAYNNTGTVSDSDGISINGASVSATLISGNTMYGNSDDGLDTWTSHDNIVEYNVAYNHRGTGEGNGFKLGGGLSGGNNIVRYNVAYDNKKNGFLSNGSGGNTYYQNVAYGNDRYGFEDGFRTAGFPGCSAPIEPRCQGHFSDNIGMNNVVANLSAGVYTSTSDYNDWYDTASGSAKISYNYVMHDTLASFQTATGGTLDMHSLSVDPLFVSPGTGGTADYTLQLTSPVVDAGDPSNPYALTLCGLGLDIGAYEVCE